MTHFRASLSIAAVLLAFFASAASAENAKLIGGEAVGMPGDTVSFPVSLLAQGNAPATIQFTVLYPASLDFQGVVAGNAAVSAEKTATAGTPSAGGVKIMITGANTVAVGDGVVALIKFGIKEGNRGDKLVVQIAEPVLSTGENPVSIPTECSNGLVTLGSAKGGCFGGIAMPKSAGAPRGDAVTWLSLAGGLVLAGLRRNQVNA